MAPPVEIPWHIIGPIATVIGALIGIGVGWGSMRVMVNAMKLEVAKLSVISTQITTLEVEALHVKQQVNGLATQVSNLSSQVQNLEVEIASIKARQPNRRK